MTSNDPLVLVTGASGFVGRCVTARLTARGIRYRTTGRGDLPGSPDHVITEPLSAETDWQDALAGVDRIIHLAGRVHVMAETERDPLALYRKTNRDGTEALLRQAKAAGVRRFLFVSTIKATGRETGDNLPEVLGQAPSDPYALSKFEAEKLVLEAASESFSAAVIRPPLVYGPGVGANFRALMKLADSPYPLPLGFACEPRSLVYVENLADALLHLILEAPAPEGIYHVKDPTETGINDLIRDLRRAYGRPARLLPVPTGLLRLLGRLAGRTEQVRRLLDRLTFADENLRRRGWQAPYTRSDALARMVEASPKD
ncbi:MAG: NAD-dependent epimerase/dehydratase family protein [Magnetovibrionaceae bacterium]